MSEPVFFLGFDLVCFPSGFVIIALFVRGFSCLVLKGYSRRLSGTITWIVGLAIIGGLTTLGSKYSPFHYTGWRQSILFCIALVVIGLMSGAVFIVIAVSLPAAHGHRSGPTARKWPTWPITRAFVVRLAPWLGMASVVGGVAELFWFHDRALGFRLIRDGIALFGIGTVVELITRIERTPTAAEAVAADPRPPVLYIRPFGLEADSFTYGAKEALKPYMEDQLTISSPAIMQMNVEQYLGPTFSRLVGPFIGLGNPGDFRRTSAMPRDYVPDERWQPLFLGYARRAAAIVMLPSNSESLLWELRQIVGNGWQTKLFVLERPTPKSQSKVVRWIIELFAWAAHIRRPTKAEFVHTMSKAGLRLSATSIEPGAIVGFDANGNAIQVQRRAQEPDDFVAPIVDWISKRRTDISQV